MHKIIIKSINPAIVLLSFSTIVSTENPWHYTFSKYPVQWFMAGATTALVIGKISYNYYQSYGTTLEQAIENCREMYKNIYCNVHHYNHMYQSDAKISDWDLKAIILDNNQDPYPFMTYYTSLTKTIWNLHNHVSNITKQLIIIDTHKKKLLINHRSEKTVYLTEMLIHLETEGKLLQQYTIRTITLMVILKNRIKLFKEYNDDCRNWAQTKHNKKIEETK